MMKKKWLEVLSLRKESWGSITDFKMHGCKQLEEETHVYLFML